MTRSFSLLAQLAAEGRLSKVETMDAPVLNLAATVKEATTALSGVADVAARLKNAAVKVAGRVGQVSALAADLEAADEALAQAVTGTAPSTSNGAPSGPLPDSVATSLTSSAPPAAPAAQPHSFERTAIGPVTR